MGYPSLAEIAEQVPEWDFIRKLPARLQGFSKVPGSGRVDRNIFEICAYEDEGLHARVSFIYTRETHDYILVRQMGMNIYRDINYIFSDRDQFALRVADALEGILAEMRYPEKRNLGEIIEQKGIIGWPYGNGLPARIGPFERYISPAQSLEHINGSIILLDYSDFVRHNQLVIYYNRYRDRFFGEEKINGVFRFTKLFDSVTLEELGELLRKHLTDVLTEMTQE